MRGAHLFGTWFLVVALATLSLACGGKNTNGRDAGVDAGRADAGQDAGNNAQDSGMTSDSGTDAGPSCSGDGGCYSCAPTTDLQFLNHCTNSQCAPFDNHARIPGFP